MNTILQFILLLISMNASLLFNSESEIKNKKVSKVSVETTKEVLENTPNLELINKSIEQRYSAMSLEKTGLSEELFRKGLTGYLNLKSEGKVKKEIITLIDFEKPSNEKRMWIIDLSKNAVLKNTLVAHGKNSGGLNAKEFSNIPNSFRSSLGCYITSNTYIGKHGLSLKLEGLDADFNTNAESRYIVLHGASYVSEDFIKCNGRLGRSHGCPAVPANENNEIIELIKGSSFLFINGTSEKYSSKYLDEEILTRKHEFLHPMI
jgi:hypothetical protein